MDPLLAAFAADVEWLTARYVTSFAMNRTSSELVLHGKRTALGRRHADILAGDPVGA